VKPHKSSINFGKGAKLSSRFVGTLEAMEMKGPMAYRLALPHSLRCMHDVFLLVSVLRHYVSNPTPEIDISSFQCWTKVQSQWSQYAFYTIAFDRYDVE
jgi:hypothetical protein